MLKMQIENVRIASCIDGRHLHVDASVNFHVTHEIRPILPGSFLFEDVNVVEDVTLGWSGNFNLSDFVRNWSVPDLKLSQINGTSP